MMAEGGTKHSGTRMSTEAVGDITDTNGTTMSPRDMCQWRSDLVDEPAVAAVPFKQLRGGRGGVKEKSTEKIREYLRIGPCLEGAKKVIPSGLHLARLQL